MLGGGARMFGSQSSGPMGGKPGSKGKGKDEKGKGRKKELQGAGGVGGGEVTRRQWKNGCWQWL